mmetsp:Transcript_34364/g.98971  ORF Transcript_34364/g.98971 Transcript_34364/m.98971 type:complete len:84 (-) Transcript_34364:8-259(-)
MHAKGGKALLDQQGGFFPIHWAACKGHMEVVKLLLKWNGTLEKRTEVDPVTHNAPARNVSDLVKPITSHTCAQRHSSYLRTPS